MKKGTTKIKLTILAFVAANAVLACRREDPSSQAINPASAAEKLAQPQAANAEPTPSAAKSAHDESAFSLSLAARGKLSKSQPGELAIVLLAKPPFHVNLEYPHRFKLISKRGLSTATDTIQRDPAKLSETKLEMSVPVTVVEAGPAGLEGEMSFSVCTSEKCLMEKRRLNFEMSGE